MANSRPSLGATFIPGGVDDFYMPAPSPEVVSPAPQRIMPEVPENMQDSIARLELDANQSPRHTNAVNFSHPNNHYQNQAPNPSAAQSSHPPRGSSLATQSQSPPQQPTIPPQNYGFWTADELPDEPNFSDYPRLDKRSPLVPLSDKEKELVLLAKMENVLNCNNPETQLEWAQYTLAYVECAMIHEERVSGIQPARSVTPRAEHQLRVSAIDIVNFLADQHHPKAEFLKGMWLEFGKFGLPVDKREAFRCYSRAADRWYGRAEYRIGMQFEQSNDAVKALIHYQKGAEMGDSASNYRLGMMTLLGQHSQPQDFSKGLELIRRAAATADDNAPQGAYVLGMLQARELPQITIPEVILPYNEQEARRNIERAAYLGFSKAQLKMGSAYELCTLGCEFSPKLSLHYNALAAHQGELEADMAISKWFLCGYEGMFPKNETLAYRHAQLAAQGGLATGQFAMGYFNEIGMNVPVDIDKALEWYETAAKNGNKDAEGRIEGIAQSGTLSKKDHENVALNKIKSQYGSKKGQRPDRFKQKETPLPSVVEYSPSEYSAATPTAKQRLPDRDSSTTPYPTSDRPPVVAPLDRPATAAPYPMADGPLPAGRPRPGPGGNLNPEFRSHTAAPPVQRPGSAFQVNPNIYAQNNDYGPPGRGGGPPRPSTAIGNGPAGQGGRPMNGRNFSGGPQGGYGAPVQRPGPGPPGPNRYDQGYHEPPRPDLALDIGYQAPLESKRPRPGPQTPTGIPGNNYQQQRPGSARPGTSGPYSTGGQMSPHPSNAPPRRDAATPQSQSRPSTTRPSAPGGRPQNNSPAPSQGRPGQGSKPPGQKPQAQTQALPPAANKPPGSGPKTFDEMGVPKTKEQGDCIVM